MRRRRPSSEIAPLAIHGSSGRRSSRGRERRPARPPAPPRSPRRAARSSARRARSPSCARPCPASPAARSRDRPPGSAGRRSSRPAPGSSASCAAAARGRAIARGRWRSSGSCALACSDQPASPQTPCACSAPMLPPMAATAALSARAAPVADLDPAAAGGAQLIARELVLKRPSAGGVEDRAPDRPARAAVRAACGPCSGSTRRRAPAERRRAGRRTRTCPPAAAPAGRSRSFPSIDDPSPCSESWEDHGMNRDSLVQLPPALLQSGSRAPGAT